MSIRDGHAAKARLLLLGRQRRHASWDSSKVSPSTARRPVAAPHHVQQRRAPPHGDLRKPPHHGVPRHAELTAADAPAGLLGHVLALHHPARQQTAVLAEVPAGDGQTVDLSSIGSVDPCPTALTIATKLAPTLPR
jgi:hypothetical protein